MKLHDVTPGSVEWHALRARCRCASEAPVIMGASRHMSRQELVRIKALGLEKEFTDYVQKKVLARGHEIEAAARAIVEAQIGEDLFPAVVTDDAEVYLSSLDGMPMDERLVFECKSKNADLEAMFERGVVDDPHYYWQLEHQLMTVPQAEHASFTISDGTEAGTKTIIYQREPGRREELIAGWDQFDKDVAGYVHVEDAKPVVGQKVQVTLPALIVELSGQVVESNLTFFKEAMLEIVASVNTDLQDDQDFANAKEGVKFCEDVETRVKFAKEQALGKMVSVDEAFKALDEIRDAARAQRLKLDKLIAERDSALKAEIIQKGKDDFAAHVLALCTRLGKPYMPQIKTDFPGCIRGKRSFKNMRDAVAGHLAELKIEANRIADGIDLNLKMLREVAADHTFLFPAAETAQLVLKDLEACRAIAEKKIADYKAEQDRIAREAEEKRQRDEAARLQREQEAQDRETARLAAAAAAPAATPAPAPIAAPAAAPQPASTFNSIPTRRPAAAAPAAPTRPTDDQIIEVLALHFRVHESKVIEWLLDVDLPAASERMAMHI